MTIHSNPRTSATGDNGTDIFLLDSVKALNKAGLLDGAGGLDGVIFSGNVSLSDAHFAHFQHIEGLLLDGTGAQKVMLGATAAAAFSGGQIAILAQNAATVSVNGAALAAGTALAVSSAAGNDTLAGGAGNDTLHGGAGNDVLRGNDGDDSLWGDDGDDRIYGGEGDDRLRGGAGDDQVWGGAGNDDIRGNEGADVLRGEAGRDIIWGGVGDDTLSGGLDADTLYGGEGADVLQGDDGDDLLLGDAGNDRLSGGAGRDRLEGGEGDDRLDGGAGADVMLGGLGDDRYTVDDAGDAVLEEADAGTDTVTALLSFTLGENVENLVLTGGAALSGTGNALANRLTGNEGDNLLSGLDGKDILLGGLGNDTLVGGMGADKLTGGDGADTFRYGVAAEGGDTIADFVSGTDIIAISASGFGGGLAAGMDLLASGHFATNTTGRADSTAGTGQFIYETDSARLWWDADGMGGKAAVQIASLSGAPLHASDIHIIG